MVGHDLYLSIFFSEQQDNGRGSSPYVLGHQGVLPYIQFARDDVLMRLYDRSYGSATDQWDMACSCLHIIRDVLKKDITPNSEWTIDQNCNIFLLCKRIC